MMEERRLKIDAYAIMRWTVVFSTALLGTRATAQAAPLNQPEEPENTLSGSDQSQHDPVHQAHFFGDWGGKRPELLTKGINFDLQYEGDLLWNVRSSRATRSAAFTRGRGTVDINFAKLTETPGLRLHVTAVWQGGANLGSYLGQFAGPSGLASENSFRLDSWWVDEAVRTNRVYVRVGQFAAADFYGNQLFGPSFIFEPLQYALDNLNETYETSDPPSTSAAELRLIPAKHLYVKSMIYAADRLPYAHKPHGARSRLPRSGVLRIGDRLVTRQTRIQAPAPGQCRRPHRLCGPLQIRRCLQSRQVSLVRHNRAGGRRLPPLRHAESGRVPDQPRVEPWT